MILTWMFEEFQEVREAKETVGQRDEQLVLILVIRN